MDPQAFLHDVGLPALLFQAFFSFAAGFVDAVAGGGGLIQLPALLVAMPDVAIPTLLGTNKIAGFSGTFVATCRYAAHRRFDYRLLLVVSGCTALAAYGGARAVTAVDVSLLRRLVLVLLVLIAAYTLLRRDLGAAERPVAQGRRALLLGALLGAVVGFYDGFLGPGTGSFLVLGFVALLGFDFLRASAYAKVVNCVSNVAALVVFVGRGCYILPMAVVMAVCNMAGSLVGSSMAIRRGNRFIRRVFLVVIALLIARYAWDVFR